MTTTLGQGRPRNFLMILTAAAFLAAVLFASSAPAHAKDRGHKNHGRKARAQQVVHYKVPKVMTYEHRGWSQQYRTGRVYHAAHNHYHDRYRFPVLYGGVVSYRPYAYCGDRLFVTGAVTLPQLALAFNFGSPGGLYIGGYYPAPPPPPLPYYIYENRYHRDGGCRHDHDHGDWDD